MPIEIRELVIKVTVHDESSRAPRRPTGPAFSPDDRAQLRKELTEDCVRQVLAALERRRER